MTLLRLLICMSDRQINEVFLSTIEGKRSWVAKFSPIQDQSLANNFYACRLTIS